MTQQRPFDPERLARLVSDLTDGCLSREESDELRELVRSNRAAADWYCEWMSMHAQLHLEFVASEELPSMPRLAAQSSLPAVRRAGATRPRRWDRRAAIVAAIGSMVAASIAWLFVVRPQPNVPNSDAARREFEQQSERPIAVLARLAVAQGAASPRYAQGASLTAGRFAIDSGAAQIEFLNGVILVVEGPADLELISSQRVFCRLGKLRARVPAQAQGFTVDTPTHSAIDLGTEFAVDVGPDQSTEFHALDGQVELRGNTERTIESDRTLELGDGFRAAADGEGLAIKAAPERFIGAQRLIELSARGDESRYESWKRWSERIATKQEVLAYFNFEGHTPWQRVLRQAAPPLPDLVDGAIVGCRWTEGRWSHKGALEWKGTENRVRIFIPGDYESLTLAAWVRIDGFDRYLSAIMLADGHDEGEVHWQFTETGQMLLGVKADMTKSQDYLSGVVLRPSDVGRWVHLASVYDGGAGEVAHYVNGRRVWSDIIRRDTVLRIGAAELGNWVPEDYKDHRVRSLNGRMDEFIIFKAALNEEQIHRMYEVGQPNS